MISPELDEEGVSGIMEKVTQSISSRGGEVEEIKRWGRRRLAYPIGDFMEAEYLLARFRLMPKPLKEVQAEMGASTDVLRYLVTRLGD